MEGVRVRGLIGGGAVRLLLVEAHGPADEARRRHTLAASTAHLTAEAMVAAALLSAHLKDDEELTLQIQGEHPRVSIYVDQTAEGDQRARTTPATLTDADTPPEIQGLMLAIKAVHGREVYRGITPIDGRLEVALSQHLTDSNQVHVVLRLHAHVDDKGTVRAAGGVLLELLAAEPGQPSMTPEAFHATYGDLTQMDASALLTELAFGSIRGEKLQLLESSSLRWQCRCSEERVLRMIASLGDPEVQSMVDDDHGAEVTCHFCNEVYTLSEAQLLALLPD
jgi:molecular chaperone Hsp33